MMLRAGFSLSCVLSLCLQPRVESLLSHEAHLGDLGQLAPPPPPVVRGSSLISRVRVDLWLGAGEGLQKT